MIAHRVESRTWEVAASDGHALLVHSWRPCDASDWSIVLLHGAASHAGWFESFGRALARRGIATHAPDRRGSGRLRELELPASPEVWIDDLRRVVTAVRARAGRVCLAPWCFGARLGVPAMGDRCAVDHLLLLAPAFAFTGHFADGSTPGLAVGSEVPLAASDEYFVEKPSGRAFMAADALRWRTMPRAFRPLSDRLNSMMMSQLPRLTAPVTGVFASRDRITDCRIGREILTDLGHPAHSIEGSHSFFLEDPESAAALIRQILT
jgi:alpha-beta hydrolase superfamily lysophospholipase